MAWSTLALVLASAFFHAAWNAMIKAEQETTASGVMVLALSGLMAAFMSLCTPGTAFPDPRLAGWAVLSGFFEAAYFLSLLWCLSLGPLSQVYGLTRGGALLFVWPLSIFFLAEPLRHKQVLGGLIVVLGLMGVGFVANEQVKVLLGRSLIAPLILCASSIAAYHLLYKKAMMGGAQAMAVFALSMSIAVPVNLLWHRKTLKAAWAKLSWPRLWFAGLLCALSFVLTLVALEMAGTGAVLTLRNTSVVFALGFSYLLKEEIPRRRVWGAIAITLGAILRGWK